MTVSQEAEREVITALLFNDQTFYGVHVTEGLRADHFEDSRLKLLYQAMVDVDSGDGGFDSIAVAARAGELGLRDAVALVQSFPLTLARPADARRHARIIRDAHLARSLRAIGRSLTSEDIDPRKALDELLDRSMELADDGAAKPARRADEVMQERIAEAAAIEEEQDVTGIPSGFSTLDRKTGGWQDGRLYIVAARPAMGKSAFVTQIAEHAARAGHVTGFWNLEMSEGEIADRLISSLSGIAASRLHRGGLTPGQIDRMMESGQKMSGAPLYLDDTPDLSVTELRAKARRMKKRVGLDLAIVDYLGLMRVEEGENRVQAVAAMSRALKVMAKQLHVPVLVLSQLNRSLETRGTTLESKRPQLHDLRDSGGIEQDADAVLFLFREGYYDADSPRADRTDIAIAKARNHPTVDWPTDTDPGISLAWHGPTMRLMDT